MTTSKANGGPEAADRKRYIFLLQSLTLAVEEIAPARWDQLVAVAVDYGRCEHLRREEFDALRPLTVGQVLAGVPNA
jgi:hypothetical protein